MARPRGFERDQVLQRAMRVFWERGYQATTMQLLVEATGVQRSGLYRTFGQKAAIYEAALSAYNDWRISRIDPSLEPRALVRRWFELAAEDARAGDVPRGCLLVLSVAEGPNLQPEQRAVIQALMDRLEAFFRTCVAASAPESDAEAIAATLIAANIGLFMMSRSGAPPERLQQVIDRAMHLIP